MVSFRVMVVGMLIWGMLVSLGTRRTRVQRRWFWDKFRGIVIIVGKAVISKRTAISLKMIWRMGKLERDTADISSSADTADIGSTAEVAPAAAIGSTAD